MIISAVHSSSSQRLVRSDTGVDTRGTLLHRERPLVFAVSSAHLDHVCSYCCRDTSTSSSSPELTLLRCKGCSLAHYCGTECYKSDWKQHHSRECRSISRLKEQLMSSSSSSKEPVLVHSTMNAKITDNIRMMARLLRLQYAIRDTEQYNAQWAQFEGCMSNRHLQKESHIAEYRKLAQLVLEFIGGARLQDEMDILKRFGHDDIVEYFCKFKTNGFALCNEEMNPIGSVLFVGNVSMMNHSCNPNCVAVFGGRWGEIEVRNIEPLDPETELVISYIPVCQSRETRQRKLLDQYCFECQCERCRDGMLSKLEDEHLRGEYRTHGLETDTKGHKNITPMVSYAMDNVSVDNKGDNYLFQQTRVSLKRLLETMDPCHETVNDLAQKLLKMSIERQSFDEAVAYARLVIQPFETLFQIYKHQHRRAAAYKYDPSLGLNWFSLGKLLWFLERSEEALHAFENALSVLRVTHGSIHRLVADVSRHVGEASAEVVFKQRGKGAQVSGTSKNTLSLSVENDDTTVEIEELN